MKSSFPPHLSQQPSLHSPVRPHQRLPSSSQPQTLFGGGTGPSIWSAAPGESALGLSPRHQGNGTLTASPLTGLAPLGHTTYRPSYQAYRLQHTACIRAAHWVCCPLPLLHTGCGRHMTIRTKRCRHTYLVHLRQFLH